MRSGSSQRGNERFARETLARVRRLAADATVTVRADAGFFSYDMIAAIGAHNACYSITIPQNAKVKAAAAAIVEAAWAGEWREGTSPSRSLRTVRDSLPSYGSHSPAFFCLGRSVGSSPEGLTSKRP